MAIATDAGEKSENQLNIGMTALMGESDCPITVLRPDDL